MLHKELNEAEEKLEQIKKRFHKRNDVKHLEVMKKTLQRSYHSGPKFR